MIKLNTNESRTMSFDVNIQGIDYNQLSGSLKFILEGVEYGFPIQIFKDHIEVNIPPLEEVVKKGLKDGEEVDCQLDIFGEGFYMKPWSGKFGLKSKVRVEAKMVYNEPDTKNKFDKNIKKSIATNGPILKEEVKEVIKEIDTDQSDTQKLLKLLEQLVSKRLTEEKDDNINKDIDLDKGIMGKKGKRTIITEPPEEDSPEDMTLEQMISSALKGERKKIKESVSTKKRVRELINKESMDKMKKVIKNTRVVSVKENKYRMKERGETITPKDVRLLFESVNMTNKSTQKRLLEKAREIGGDGVDDIYHALKGLLGPVKLTSSFEEYMTKQMSKK